MFPLCEISLHKLKGVHDDLIKVVKRAAELTTVEFVVIEGLRTMERQKQLMEKKATTTLNSRHLDGHAVDLCAITDGKPEWKWTFYPLLSKAMKAAATELKIQLEWGGDWKVFKDGTHFQLPWEHYYKK